MSNVYCSEPYIVKAGDTCWDIAQKHNLTVSILQELNPPLIKCSELQIGQKICVKLFNLKIGNVYNVKQGDTCWDLAQKNNISFDDFKKYNPQVDCDNLQINQPLIVGFPSNTNTNTTTTTTTFTPNTTTTTTTFTPNTTTTTTFVPTTTTLTTTTTTAVPKTNPARVYKSYARTDYYGADIQKEAGNSNTCQSRCDNIPNCVGFVTDGQSCWFKNSSVSNLKPVFDPKFTYYYTGTGPLGGSNWEGSGINALIQGALLGQRQVQARSI